MKQILECLVNQFSKSISFLLFMEGNFFRIMVVFEFKWNIQVYLEAGLTPRRMRNPYNNTKYQLYILHKKSRNIQTSVSKMADITPNT